MEKTKAMLAGLAIFVIGTSILVAGILVANRQGASAPATAPTTRSSMAMAARGMAARATPVVAAKKLQIVHVAQGCHAFALGDVQTPAMTLQVRRGQTVDLTNLDVDNQRMMKVAGPRTSMPDGMMKMAGGEMAMTFSQAGTYRFRFTQPPMPGAADEGDDASNPDNDLTLSVNAV